MENNLLKIDTESLAQVAVKLIETFSNGISGLYKPLQKYLMAIVESKKLILENKTKIKIVKENVTFLENELKDCTPRDLRTMNNLIVILSQSLSNLPTPTTDLQISDEWMAMFIDYAKDISDDEIRVIWSNLLSKETASPGSYSKRTMSVLKNLEKQEAEWFVECAAFVIDFKIPTQIFQNYDFNKIQTLIDCGLLNATECTAEIDDSSAVLKGKTAGLSIEKGFRSAISFNCFTLTDAGAQLWNIIDVRTDEGRLKEIKNTIETTYKGSTITIVNI